LPEVGLSIKEIKFKRVDFPEPEGPTNEYIFPFLKLKLILFIETFYILLSSNKSKNNYC